MLCSFVADGRERARAPYESSIRAAVEKSYAERMQYIGWLRRWLLRREMKREIEKRLERCAPSGALYFRNG